MKRLLALLLMLAALPSLIRAEDQDFVSLFNGKDLSNWVNVNCAPETFTVKDGMIHCTGKPIGALRTPKMYENFILELEWRHLEVGGNSGVFVWASPIAAPGVPFLRAIEVQVLDNGYNAKGKNEWYTTHGDLFPIHGSSMKPIYKGNGMRCFPIEERSKSSPEWNHYRVTANKGTLRLEVNGKQVSGGDECNYCKGFLGLESEGGAIDFRNIKIKELPSTEAPKEKTAAEALAWKPLYTGVDLRGWKLDEEQKKLWKANDWQLVGSPKAGMIWTEQSFSNFELIVDIQIPKKLEAKELPKILIGNAESNFELLLGTPENGLPVKAGWNRLKLIVKDQTLDVVGVEGKKLMDITKPTSSNKRMVGLSGCEAEKAVFANLYIRELK